MPTDWTYAKHGGLNYQAEPGSRWVVGGGDHPEAELWVGSLIDLPIMPRAALAYADPPWNQGNRNSFHTKARVEHAGDEFVVFLDRLLACIQDSAAWAIEMGKQNAALLDSLIAKRYRVPSEYDVTYYRRHPSKLFTGTRGDFKPRVDPAGLDDDDTPAWAINEFTQPGDLVVDPVTGRGLTAVTALKMGRRFAGYELSQHRASVTLTKLAALTLNNPRRIA